MREKVSRQDALFYLIQEKKKKTGVKERCSGTRLEVKVKLNNGRKDQINVK